jgi:hypothetical protein
MRVMMKSLFNHHCAWRSGDLRDTIIEDVYCDGTGSDYFRSNRCMTAQGQLFHNVSTDVFV